MNEALGIEPESPFARLARESGMGPGGPVTPISSEAARQQAEDQARKERQQAEDQARKEKQKRKASSAARKANRKKGK